MSNNIVLQFPDDLATWPQSFTDFQTAQAETTSPELAPVVTPSNPTIVAPAVPVEFTVPGNQPSGDVRTVW
jgi:hypothetical protein